MWLIFDVQRRKALRSHEVGREAIAPRDHVSAYAGHHKKRTAFVSPAVFSVSNGNALRHPFIHVFRKKHQHAFTKRRALLAVSARWVKLMPFHSSEPVARANAGVSDLVVSLLMCGVAHL